MDNKLTLPQVVAATAGKLIISGSLDTNVALNTPGTLTFENTVYDSREVSPGTLFVALPGEVSDGHNYISQALEKGATACLVRASWAEAQENLPAEVAWIIVEDPLTAFQKLVAAWRSQFGALKVIGITGSVGKTSTKELLSVILAQKFQVFKSPKSVNTEQSLLPVMLKLQASDQVAVIEMGAGYQLGELTRLCAVAQPAIGLELGVSESHIGRMGSLENIARNKAELVEALPQTGLAILNGDDPRVAAMRASTRAQVFTYGLQPDFDLWASEIETRGLAGIAFTAHYAGQSQRLESVLRGRHSVYTALAAIAVALHLGLDWSAIQAGLRDTNVQVRLLVEAGLNGSTLIDDSYNASPVSTVAALDLLADTGRAGRRFAVLGDMLELGTYAVGGHQLVGKHAVGIVDHLLVVGPLAYLAGLEAIKQGLAVDKVTFAETKQIIIDWLSQNLQSGDYLLIKASRGSHLEEIVEKVRAAG